MLIAWKKKRREKQQIIIQDDNKRHKGYFKNGKTISTTVERTVSFNGEHNFFSKKWTIYDIKHKKNKLGIKWLTQDYVLFSPVFFCSQTKKSKK